MRKKSRPSPTPNSGWFPKGHTGNPKGRPRSTRTSKTSVLEVLVDKTFSVNDPGGTREISVEEALQLRTYQDALAGKSMAMREVVKWIIKREAWLVKNTPKPTQPVRYDTAHDPDNADSALLLLGIAAHNPARAGFDKDRAQLLLEPWAVQAALRRRRGGQRLSDKERGEIRRCTRDADNLRWPRLTGE